MAFKKGNIPWNKGLSKENNEKLRKMGEKISRGNKGKIPWNKGLTKKTDKRIKVPSTSFKKGETPWNKGLKKENDKRVKKTSKKLTGREIKWKEKISKTLTGVNLSEEHKKNISKSLKGNKRSWKGGTTYANKYKKIWKPEHPRAISTDYVLEHILVAEKMLGRFLKKEEIVHHINFKRGDNRPENLYICKNHLEHGKCAKNLFKIVPYLMEKGYLKFDKEKGEYYI